METLWQDLRYGFRMLARNPGFTAVAVLTLALGIGANIAIFTVVNSVLLQPLPYKGSEQLVALFLSERDGDDRLNPTSPANFLVWKAESRTLEQMTAAHPWSPALTGRSHPDQLEGLKASASLFDLLGVEPLHGRTFLPEEGEPGGDHVVVLGHGLWQRRFGGDRDIIGQTLILDGKPYMVIGVMPQGFHFPPFWATQAEMWVPLAFEPRDAMNQSRHLRTFARLRPGVTLADVRAEMTALQEQLKQVFPDANAGTAVNVDPLREPVVSSVRPALLVLLATVGVVLLIACANVANLLLARASVREKEIAIRAALGAARSRLVRQLMTESVLLALLGVGLGSLFAYAGVRALIALSPPDLPRLHEIGFQGAVFGFTLVVSALTVLLFGLAPSWLNSQTNLNQALQEGGRRTSGATRSRLRGTLIVAEVALSVVLLTGAALLVRSFLHLQQLDPGFRKQSLLTMTVPLAGSSHVSPEEQNLFFQEVRREVESLPGVMSAAFINHLPLGGDIWSRRYVVEGQPVPPPEEIPTASFRVATPGYFETMGIQVVRGRAFGEQDRQDSLPVVIVNQKLAERAWPGGDPLGRRLRTGKNWLTVVGVEGDVRQWDLTQEVRPEIYFPYAQNPAAWWLQTSLVVHTGVPPESLVRAVQAKVWAIDPLMPVTNIRPMEQILAHDSGSQRFNAILLALFSLLAVVLAAVGIYGVISYSVSQRTHEIGIRMALGAQPRDIFRLVVGQGMVLTLIGVAVGLVGAFALTRFLSSLLFGVSTTDPATFAGVALLLAAVALLACYFPARRATRVDPLVALRYE